MNKEKIGKNCYRIFGMAAATKEELRSRTPALEAVSRKRIMRIAESIGAIGKRSQEERIWLATGLSARRRLADFWRENFSPIALEVEGGEDHYRTISEKTEKFRLCSSSAAGRGLRPGARLIGSGQFFGLASQFFR